MDDTEMARLATSAVGQVLRGRPADPDDFADMRQDALIAVWEAVEGFDGRGDVGGHAVMRARWAVIDGIRARRGRVGHLTAVSPRSMLTLDTCDWRAVPDAAPGPEQEALARIEIEAMATWLSTLAPRVASAVRACAEGEQARMVAKRWGVSSSRICQIRRAALTRFQEEAA